MKKLLLVNLVMLCIALASFFLGLRELWNARWAHAGVLAVISFLSGRIFRALPSTRTELDEFKRRFEK